MEFIEAPLFTQLLPEYLTDDLFLHDTLIWFVTLYGKDEAADLTASEKRVLKAAVDEEKRRRVKRPGPRRK